MNKAELKAKANEYFDCVNCHTYADTEEDLREDVTEAFIAGYEARNEEVKTLKEKIHWWKKEVNVAHKAREEEFEKLVIENKVLKRKIENLQKYLDTQNSYRECAETCVKLNEAKELIEELASSLSVVGECGKEECELIDKVQKFINKPIF